LPRPTWTIAAGLLAALGGCGSEAVRTPEPAARPQRAALAPVVVPPEVAKAYQARGHRPIWVDAQGVKPEGKALLHRLATADVEGLDPAAYRLAEIQAAIAAGPGDRAAMAHADLLLSRAYATYLSDLHRPVRTLRYIDEGIAPEPADVPAALAGPKPGQAARLNPLYEALRSAAVQWRAAHPQPGARDTALIRANLERARAIPARPSRYIVVDTGSARLWMIDGDKVEGPMRVIVGKPNMQTPAIAGLLRFVALNPYWNVPPDLAGERAKRVLKEGTGFLTRERIEVLSDWGDSPRVIKFAQVNWRAAATGKVKLRMRQLPGGANVMGAVKFMMPNEFGIYLHDFPEKSLFARSARNISSGCVRVSDAPRLAAWLFNGAAPRPRGNAPEQRVDLPEPVPVYLTYLTMLPAKGGGLVFGPDPYKRDPAALAAMNVSPNPRA
jgi:murein L,D-transpeptidase YcbB/YkuD